MFRGAAPKGKPVVCAEGQVVAYVRLHGNNDTPLLEHDVRQGVGSEYPGRSRSEDADTDEFPGMQILGNPGIGGVVLMMHGMHVLVQEAYFVMRRMPDEVFSVENGQSGHVVPAKFPQGGSQWRKVHWFVENPLQDSNWHDVENLKQTQLRLYISWQKHIKPVFCPVFFSSLFLFNSMQENGLVHIWAIFVKKPDQYQINTNIKFDILAGKRHNKPG